MGKKYMEQQVIGIGHQLITDTIVFVVLLSFASETK